MMDRAHDPELKTAERYFLGELTDDEAEAFEAHYFDCARCAEYVVEELAMLESGREVAKAVQQAPLNVVPLTPRRRRDWLPAAAAAILVLAVGTPMLMRDRATPRVYSGEPIRIQFSADRGAATPQPVRGEIIQLDIEIPPIDSPRFEVSVRNEAGEIVHQRHAYPAERTNVFLVLSGLPAGTYNVVIEGVREDGNRSLVARQPFEVRGDHARREP